MTLLVLRWLGRLLFVLVVCAVATLLAAVVGTIVLMATTGTWLMLVVFPFSLMAGMAGLLFGSILAAPVTLILLPVVALVVPRRFGLRSVALVVAGGCGGVARIWIDVVPTGKSPLEAMMLAGGLAGAAAGIFVAQALADSEAGAGGPRVREQDLPSA